MDEERRAYPGTISRRERVLSQEVLACDDPICCCEAEPRWLRLRDEAEGRGAASEWGCLERVPNEEL